MVSIANLITRDMYKHLQLGNETDVEATINGIEQRTAMINKQATLKLFLRVAQIGIFDN